VQTGPAVLASASSTSSGGSGSGGGSSKSPAAPLPTPSAVRSQGRSGSAPVATQSVSGRAAVAGAARSLVRRVVAGALPFTGVGLLLWVLIGLGSLAAGVGLRSRRVTLA
jgi:hypothetical protein